MSNIAADLKRPSMEHFKKPSFAKRVSSKDNRSHERSLSKDLHATNKDRPHSPLPGKPVTVELIMESPPALMMDTPEQSSGALISGRLRVRPTGSEATLNSITMYLECTTTTKKPVQDRCRACQTQVNDLYEWHFLTKPRTFKGTAHEPEELPFSHLIPGHLPATTHGHLGSIEYSLHVRARTADGQEVEHRRDIVIMRALRPGNDKNSMRIFPPTNLTLHVTLPSLAYPIGETPVLFRLNGVTTTKDDKSQLRWRLRKIVWRIIEQERAIAPACAAHAAKVGGEGKGIAHEHERDLGAGELKRGWKVDYLDAAAGQIEGEFPVAIDGAAHPQCDVAAPNGTAVTHALVLELVIAEEWVPGKHAKNATPTGSARVLRTQFGFKLTQRAGLGIAWDDEAPPMYEDVPESPPHYAGGAVTFGEWRESQEEIVPLNLDGNGSSASVEADQPPPFTDEPTTTTTATTSTA